MTSNARGAGQTFARLLYNDKRSVAENETFLFQSLANAVGSGTVYVLVDGEIKPVSVQIGITDNRNTEVVSGELNVGDRVVVGENSTGDKKPSSVGMRMF